MFLVGVLFQRNWQFINKWIVGKLYIWALVLLGVIVLDQWVGIMKPGNHPSIIYYLVLSFFIASFATHSNGLWSRWMKGNDISYGIYIYHMVVVNFLLVLGLTGSVMYLILAVGVTVMFALLSWLIVEKPALRLKPKSIHRV
ncbi:hypothetical protein MNBD_GAMMA12-1629 [hydrothermal vent metagenome]|uniref:Acyltransferase 3 domain-containing protein n=1 Tax=hydrothermal vent metagenome TaxID=652676 RepID=A0A3B0YNQ3_9ZZZZ